MARKSSSALAEDDLFVEAPRPKRLARPIAHELDDAEESPFLRGQTRIPVRRGSIPQKTARRIWHFVLAGLLVVLVALAAYAAYGYGKHDWHFRVDSGENIGLAGNSVVSRSQVMEVMGSDIGRNIFFVPLAERKQQLEQIPWVESATVMRFTPNQLKVTVKERTPVAFVQMGSRILLLDAAGHLLEQPPGRKAYNFPVITGMLESEPLSTRAARMKMFAQLTHDLDAGGEHYSKDLSEVNLSDPEDVKVLASSDGGEVMIHLGSENFLPRYQSYLAHVATWRQQFNHIESVDLRVDGQAIVNPGGGGAPASVPPQVPANVLPTKPKKETAKSAAPAPTKPTAKASPKAGAKPSAGRKG